MFCLSHNPIHCIIPPYITERLAQSKNARLRELALRTTAQRVDAQMQEARRESGIHATWPASERVLGLCVVFPHRFRARRGTRRAVWLSG